MKQFKFFQKSDKLFPDWMDRMDDHILGGIQQPREYREVLVISASPMDFMEWRSIYYPHAENTRIDFFQVGNVRYHSALSVNDILGRVFHDVQIANDAYQEAGRNSRIDDMINYARPLFRR